YVSNEDIQIISLFWCLYFDTNKMPLNNYNTKRRIKVISSLWNILREIYESFKKQRSITTTDVQVPPVNHDFYTTDVLSKSEIIHHTLITLIIDRCPTIKHLKSSSNLIGSSHNNDYTEIILKYPRFHECFTHLNSFESRSNSYRGTSFDILSEI
ncbi:3304_t:CDS:1, partial [Scutellospora calospora]